MGLESRNGRTYLPEALAQAARLYEDAKVNVNHPKGNPAGPRDYQDRIGTIRNVAMRPGEGLFADFHFNPKHALAEQLIWDAEHAPENVGFSHNVEARTGRRGERVVVEAITRVQSVDLVADPATTRGLFESAAARSRSGTVRIVADAQIGTVAAKPLTLDDLKRDYPELVESIRREQAAEIEPAAAGGGAADGVGSGSAEARRGAAAAPRVRLARPRGGRAVGEDRRQRAVPRVAAGGADERAMRALVEERARLVRTLAGGQPAQRRADARPQSRDQHLVYAAEPLDAKSFVEAIT